MVGSIILAGKAQLAWKTVGQYQTEPAAAGLPVRWPIVCCPSQAKIKAIN